MYEYSTYLAIGGDSASGPYELRSPWNTPAELLILSAGMDGAGTVYLSLDNAIDSPTIMAAGWRGQVFPFAAAGAVTPTAVAVAVPGGRAYVLVVAQAGVHGWLNYVWRRLAPQLGTDTAEREIAATHALQQAGKGGTDSWENLHPMQAPGARQQQPRLLDKVAARKAPWEVGRTLGRK